MRISLRVCLLVLVVCMTAFVFSPKAAAITTASPTSLSFGSVAVNSSSSSATIVLTNQSSRSTTLQSLSSSLSQFTVTGPTLPLTLQGNQSVSFSVVFKPTAAASLSGNITFTLMRRYTSTVQVAVSGTGTSTNGTLSLSTAPTSLSFPNVRVGNSLSLSSKLTNTGTGSVTISQITTSGAGFSTNGVTLPLTLAAGQSATLGVAFKSTAVGSYSGSISIVSNASGSPTAISLTASAVQSQISVVPGTISFGSVAVGVTNTQTVTVRNPGGATLTISQATISGTGFAKSGITVPLNVAAGGSTTFTVSYSPTSATTTTGTLTLVSNAQTPNVSVAISGTGTSQSTQLTANPTSVAFGSVTVQTSKSQSVTLTNTGNASITLSQVTVAGAGFTQSGLTLPLTLAAGQSTTFSAIFDPATSGALAGTATVVSNATNSPTTISLAGTGAAVAAHSIDLSWGSSTSSVAGYYVYSASKTGGPYTRLNSSPMSSTSYTDAAVTSGQTYFFVTTAVDSSGLESNNSNEVTAVIP